MTSLFIRILLWFLLAAAASVLIVVSVNQWFAQPTLFNLLVGGLLNAQLEQAREAYEREGEAGLRRTLAAVERGFAPGVRVAGADGRDLLTGEDLDGSGRGRNPARFGRRAWSVVNRAPMLTRATADGRYRIFLPLGRSTIGPLLLRPQILLALLAVALVCWALARHISRPILELQRVVERFGKGDTSVRARSARADEIGRLAVAFDGMADRIEELVQGQRRLLLDISHELRSPLARLTIATDLLRTDPADAASLAQIELESERLNQMIGEILQAARPEQPDARRRFEPVPLDAVLSEIVEACRIEATDGRRIELTMSATGAESMLQGQREELRRAIENVVRNAVRHAPAGTAIDVVLRAAPAPAASAASATTASAWTSASASASAPAANASASASAAADAPPMHVWLRLTVRDRGPGVPEAALPHLFTPFYRVDADRERRTGGVGLGLAIARRAVELHAGRIAARNASPGLEVEILLPPGGAGGHQHGPGSKV
jgi:two-component system sensor histidine kinase CpxA